MNLAPVLRRLSAGGQLHRPVRLDLRIRDLPSRVGQLGADFIRAQQRAGVAATAKHFPGLVAARNQDHRHLVCDVERSARDPALGRRATLSGRDRGRREARHGSRGLDIPRLTRAAGGAVRHRVVQGELRGRPGSGASRSPMRSVPVPYGPTGARPSEPKQLSQRRAWNLLLCAEPAGGRGSWRTRRLSHGLANGSLSNSAFTASVQRVPAPRRSPLNPNRVSCSARLPV